MNATATHPSPWVLATEPTSLGDPVSMVTLVDGQTFSLSNRTGDFSANPTNGVFFADMRVLSQAKLMVGGVGIESLAVSRGDSSSATFVGRSVPFHHADPRLLVVRRRRLGSVLHEDIELRNTGPLPISTVVELEVAADFADVFAIKEGRPVAEGQHSVEITANSLLFGWRLGDVVRRAELMVEGPTVQISNHGFAWHVTIPPRSMELIQLDLRVALGDEWIERQHHHPDLPFASVRNRSWLSSVPALITNDRSLSSAYDRSIEDVGALRMHDPSGRRKPVIAAGAPWYMTLFGRDALISSYMSMPVDPELGLGVLEALAELQGARYDTTTEEQPGRMLHETRFLGVDAPTLAGGSTYFGSADSTPLFVMLLGEVAKWGLDEPTIRRLLPHADRALAWMLTDGDPDGDGYIEYQRLSERGLPNQGWKDSPDAIRYHDGRVAEAPLALCEVQAYAYAAYRARAALARHLDEAPKVIRRYTDLADRLKVRFNRDFWLAQHGWFAVALGPDKKPVDSLTSNIGHCLWTGIVTDDHAQDLVKRLMSPEMWTGWGIRTLAADEPAYDPMSYHCGTVWPHDSALCALGLSNYGFTDEALWVARGLLAAAREWSGRLPELFAGFDRADVETPVPFPTSCSPQAWAAATPFLLVRLMLGMEPSNGEGFTLSPIPGAIHGDVAFTGARRFDGRWDVGIDDGRTFVRRIEDSSESTMTLPPPLADAAAEPAWKRWRRRFAQFARRPQ